MTSKLTAAPHELLDGATFCISGVKKGVKKVLGQSMGWTGDYRSQVEALASEEGRPGDAAEPERAGEKAGSSSVVGWLQRLLGRCKKPTGKELAAAEDMTALILQHY